jgi:hypothetical protein
MGWNLATEAAKYPSNKETDTKYDEGQEGHRFLPTDGCGALCSEDFWL